MSMYSFQYSLRLVYARINDLEQRDPFGLESYKLMPLYQLANELLDTGRGLTHQEVVKHKLQEYAD